jgi:hypothetical protein
MKKLFYCLLLIVPFATKAQFPFINLKSITHNGVTDTVDNAPIVVDNGASKVTVSGNKKITGSQYDAVIAQQISNGVMTWTQSFNLSTQKCWVTASIMDGSGNVYITGGVATGTTNGVDLFVQCYNSGGSPVWTYTYNGPNSTMDVGTGLAWDGSNGIYVCGASDGTNTALTDFVTIKLKSSTGATMWTPDASRYNYSNSYDAATSIVYNSTTSYVEVTGPSGTTYTDWDIATVAYKSSSGAQQWVNRVANPGGNEDKAFGLATDTLGNAYAVGTTWNSTNGSYDISVQKLDTALNQVWIKSFDGGYNLDDAGFSMGLDDSLNIYVVGTGYYQDTTLSNLLVVKYDNSGNEKWNRKYKLPATGSSAEGLRVKIKNMDEIFVGGNFISNNNQDMGFLRYNRAGKLTMEKYYNGSMNGEDKFLDIALGDSNYVYVSGRSYAGGTLDSNIVLTYQYATFTTSLAGDSTMKYANNELIIGFHPKTLKMSTINNRQRTFGTLSEFVADSTCNKINAALGGSSTNSQQWMTRKIFDLTEEDSLSETRLGDYIKIPKFYANLIVSIDPSAYSLKNARDSIRRIKPDIYFADFDLAIKMAGTNDTLFPKQYSLHTSTLYPNAYVNVDSAWAITSGVPTIKVGVYDTGIEFDHPDFNGISWGGFNFVDGVNIVNQPGQFIDNDNHGTGVAGVMGARRNNQIGIAGIVGGDADSSKIGCSIYDCRVIDGGQLILMGPLADAMNRGFRGTNINGGFGLHISNHSYYISWNNVDTMKYPLIQEQLIFGSRNGSAFVGAKNQSYLPSQPTWQLGVFPGDWNPEIVSSVAMSGNDGHNCSVTNTNCSVNDAWGFNLDYLAPGSLSIVTTCTTQQWMQPGGYSGKQGCSFAAPHVAGLMAMMMSYWNKPYADWNNLVHEDCENIIKMNCTDLANPTYSESTGPDLRSGYGKINAYQTLKKINKNYYRIHHIDAAHATSVTTTLTPVTGTILVPWPGNIAAGYSPSYTPLPINAGTYSTQIFELKTTLTYTLDPAEKIVGKWPFYKGCIGWDSGIVKVHDDRPYFTRVDTIIGKTTAVLKTYVWYNVNNGIYYPNTTSNIRSAFTLYTYDSTGTAGVHENKIAKQNSFQVHPNPSYDQFTLSFYTEHYDLLNYQIFDILGKEIKRDSFKTSFGNNAIDISFRGSYGVYILKVFDGKKLLYTQKLIKND